MFGHSSDGPPRARVKRVLKLAGLGVVVVGVGIQFIPVKEIGTNPPERFALEAPPAVAAILRRACFDCHTNETRWPVYSRIAPGSWLMARDIHKGRTHLNFSAWSSVDDDERQDDLQTCWEQVESGEMPPWFYVFPMHPAAKLLESDKAQLKSYFLRNAKTPDVARPTHLSEGK
jgi:hypothetical protein